jgi:3-hydroxyacyl-CoA dehydrogenase
LTRLRVAPTLAEAVQGAEWVVESVVEDLEVKHALLREVEVYLPPHALLTSTASWLPAGAIAQPLRHKARFLTTHPANPPWFLTVVEVVPTPDTAPEAVTQAVRSLEAIGSRPVVLRRDYPGYVANRLLFSWIQWGLAAVAAGQSPRAVDAAQRFRLGLPRGPCEVADFLRMDLVYRVLRVAEAWGWETPPPAKALLERLLGEGRLGPEAGRGLYDYPERRWRPQDLSPGEAEGVDPIPLFSPALREAGRLLREGVVDPEGLDAIGTGFVGWHRSPRALAREIGRAALARALGGEDGDLDALFVPY